MWRSSFSPRNPATNGAASERGQIVMMAGLLLPLVLGFMGLAIDLGLIAAKRRDTQNGADAAALAGAGVLLDGGSITSAKAAAQSWAQKNGYDPAGTTVNIPPLSGAHAGDSNYVEVLVRVTTQTLFIRALHITSATVQSRGVAGFIGSPKNYALVVLDKTMCSAYSQSSSSTLTINGGAMMVNSSCQPAASQSGGSSLTATDINYAAGGSWSLSNNATTSVPPTAIVAPIADPLASLAPPVACPPTPVTGCIAASPDSGGTATNPSLASPLGSSVTLRPGTFYGGLKIAGTGTVTFLPGTYVFAGGGFDYTSTTNISGSGVTFFNTDDPNATRTQDQPCGAMAFQGSGTLTLNAPTSGTYENMLFWQSDTCTAAMKYAGSSYTTTGVIYLPQAQLNVSGGGNLGALQVIVDSFSYTGSTAVTINYANYVPILPPHLALVE